jgi:hypothetical protein
VPRHLASSLVAALALAGAAPSPAVVAPPGPVPTAAQPPAALPPGPIPAAPIPAAPIPPLARSPLASPVGIHLLIGLQLDGKPGVSLGLGLRVQHFVLSWRWWAQDAGGDGDRYAELRALQVAWFPAPGSWGGFFLALGGGPLRYHGTDTYDELGTWVPGFTSSGAALELEVGVSLLSGTSVTNAISLSLVAVVPIEEPAVPDAVDFSPPVVAVRLELNPLLLGMFLH